MPFRVEVGGRLVSSDQVNDNELHLDSGQLLCISFPPRVKGNGHVLSTDYLSANVQFFTYIPIESS